MHRTAEPESRKPSAYAMAFSREARRKLHQRNWTQAYLASLVGAERSNLNKYLNLDRNRSRYKNWPSKLMADVADVLDISLDEIKQGSESGSVEAGFGVPSRSESAPVVQIAVLKSGDLAYTRDIADALIRKLETAQGLPWRLRVTLVRAGPTDPWHQPSVREAWRQSVKLVTETGPYGYLVTVGTQASFALQEHLGDGFGRTVPVIFLGVTYPHRAAPPHKVPLVSDLTGRSEERNVAGVAYCAGLKDIASQVYSLFQKKQKLAFIYRHGIPQDELAARDLASSPLYPEALSVTATEADPRLRDMPDPDTVYLSWYTLERMLEAGTGLELLRQRLVVTSTRANVEANGLAVAGVSGDDRVIGRWGASIIIQHASGTLRRPLGSLPVRIPETCYWINRTTAIRRGVSFDASVLRTAVIYA